MPMIEHKPTGDGETCAQCGEPYSKHRAPRVRPEHKPVGDPCDVCGLAASQHRERERERLIVGIDGEGLDYVGADGQKKHLYTYLAAVDELGRVHGEARSTGAGAGLSHDECMAFFGRLPQNTLKFGFMFSYDLTKILEEMPPRERWYLLRPDYRRGKRCLECNKEWAPKERSDCGSPDAEGGVSCSRCGSERGPRDVTIPIYWSGRSYDYMAGSIAIGGRRRSRRDKRRKIKVWDCFRFFGTSFVNALDDWKIGTDDERALIRAMKEKRGEFDREAAQDVERYCKKECHLLAVLMRKVIDSHEAAGIPLKRFEGAGSTAAALLRKYKVEEFRGPHLRELPKKLQHAIECAFFGGRFENSTVGVIDGPVYGFDISSAYPYALTPLACLKCGKWRRVTGSQRELVHRAREADYAVLRFQVRSYKKKERDGLAWCPLPCRDQKGSIVYGTNFSGWAWAEEILPALESDGMVSLLGEGWFYETPCTHRPFAFMPATYRKRLEWGKEGPGKCLKLGMNASYGKTAQQVGGDKAPFQSLVWAGVTTATCRGQLWGAMSRAKNAWSVLAVATDGIYATEKLSLALPEDTGTGDLPKPLGGWEMKDGCDCKCDLCKAGKHCENADTKCSFMVGCLFVKPGLYYRLDAPLGDIRARGIGRREVFRDRDLLVNGFLNWDRKDFSYGVTIESRRFWGAKNSTVARGECIPCGKTWPGALEKACPNCGEMGTKFTTQAIMGKNGKPAYGLWDERESMIKFDPYPKREREFGTEPKYSRLHVRDLEGIESAPYEGKTTPEGMTARGETEDDLEQSDWTN